MSPRAAAARRRVRTQRTVRLGGVELPLDDTSVLAAVEADEHARYLRRRDELAPLPPRDERSATAETPWQASIQRLARTLQVYCYHPKLSRWSERGWPDLSLLGPRALWIECKTDSGVLTEKQVEVIDLMIACDLEVHVMRPWHGLQLVADVLTSSASGDGHWGPTRCRA